MPKRTARKSALNFGHPPRVVAFWRKLVREALATGTPTPFYIFSADPVREALEELRVLGPDTATPPMEASSGVSLPIRHWFSCKTQPVAPLLRWWRKQGRPIEVVSEFEYLAARHEGFDTENLLINGPAKHRWLPRHAAPGLRVNFDSIKELRALLPLARKLNWRVGLRIHTSAETDAEHGGGTQFGVGPDAGRAALDDLNHAGLKLETLHFHLRTNVESAAVYGQALEDVRLFCRHTGAAPRFLDCGGGIPPRHTRAPDGRGFADNFSLRDLADVLARWLPGFPGLEELWLENGRFLTARSGVLVTKVIDWKERDGVRQYLCDGGRTMNALVATWEDHELLTVPPRRGPTRPAVVYGPTCMNFDRLARRDLPKSLDDGDHLVWLEAGAYHIPWETRFSHGAAAVLWHEDGKLTVARDAERFESWWSQWR